MNVGYANKLENFLIGVIATFPRFLLGIGGWVVTRWIAKQVVFKSWQGTTKMTH